MLGWQQYLRISRLLNPSVKLRVRQVATLYFERARRLQDAQSLYAAAVTVLRPGFPHATSEQLDVLAAYLLGVVASAQESLQGNLAALESLGEMTCLRMQQMMDRRSKFISTLSNILTKCSTTQDSIIQNVG